MPDTSPSSAPRRRSARLASSWRAVVWVAALLSSATAFVAGHLPRRIERSERGDIAAGLAWALLGVVAAIAIWGVLQALGIDVVDEIRSRLGL